MAYIVCIDGQDIVLHTKLQPLISIHLPDRLASPSGRGHGKQTCPSKSDA